MDTMNRHRGGTGAASLVVAAAVMLAGALAAPLAGAQTPAAGSFAGALGNYDLGVVQEATGAGTSKASMGREILLYLAGGFGVLSVVLLALGLGTLRRRRWLRGVATGGAVSVAVPSFKF